MGGGSGVGVGGRREWGVIGWQEGAVCEWAGGGTG